MQICENLHLKTLRSRLEVLEKESSVFPRRAPEASAASRESATWGSDVELEAMESEQTGLAFSLPPSPEHVRANSLVEFTHEYLYPSPGARDTVSFGLDDILLTAAFLQERLERRLSPFTLRVYVAAIAAHHDAVNGRSLGKHDVIVRLNPSRPPLVPSWDLSIVLAGLQRGPFEPLDSVELKFLSLKTALLTALTSIKRVGDLQAFSVSEECLVFGPVYSHVVLRPRPGYVPKVPTTPFRDQVVNLQALPSEEADPALALLCPVRALRIYVDRTRSVRNLEQHFVCHGGQMKEKAVSKQRLAHWIVEAVALAYQSQGEPCSLHQECCLLPCVGARRLSGGHLQSCGLSTPNTFARFYSLRVEPVSSRVLGNR